MPELTIEMSDDAVKIITKLANDQYKTPKEYIETMLYNHSEGKIKAFFIDKIKDKTTAELIALLGDIE